MSSNLNQFREWISMAVSDLKSAITLYRNGLKASVVFHAQQFAEKICKALLVIFGEIPVKSHFPSRQLEKIIDDYLLDGKIGSSEKDYLDTIVTLSATLEDEKAKPRYGVFHANKLIKPDDLYSNVEITLFLNDAIVIAKKFIEFLKIKGLHDEMVDLVGILEDLIDEFDKIKREESKS